MRFVIHTAKGVALDLPDTLRLISRDGDMGWRFLLKAERPGITPVLATPEVWCSYRTEHVHGWKTLPPPRLIYLAMRRDAAVDPDVAEEWGRHHSMTSDVAWYRRRRAGNRAVSAMTNKELAETFGACLREAIEREADRVDKELDVRERLLNPLVAGRPLAMLTPAELDDLWVAIDWHRSGRPA